MLICTRKSLVKHYNLLSIIYFIDYTHEKPDKEYRFGTRLCQNDNGVCLGFKPVKYNIMYL